MSIDNRFNDTEIADTLEGLYKKNGLEEFLDRASVTSDVGKLIFAAESLAELNRLISQGRLTDAREYANNCQESGLPNGVVEGMFGICDHAERGALMAEFDS